MNLAKQEKMEYRDMSGVAQLREVYEISQRIEAKIDRYVTESDRRFSLIEQRLSNIEGRSAIIAIAWSSLVAILGVILENFFKK